MRETMGEVQGILPPSLSYGGVPRPGAPACRDERLGDPLPDPRGAKDHAPPADNASGGCRRGARGDIEIAKARAKPRDSALDLCGKDWLTQLLERCNEDHFIDMAWANDADSAN